MAKTHRKAHRKSHRKSHRKAHRKAHRKSHRKTHRKMRGGMGLFSKLYSPVGHAVMATGEAVGTVTNSVRDVAKTGLRGLNRIGRSVTGHANAAVRNVVSRKRRANRK